MLWVATPPPVQGWSNFGFCWRGALQLDELPATEIQPACSS